MSATHRGETSEREPGRTNAPSHRCPRCSIGHLHKAAYPYSALLDGMLFSVPNVPAGECDICGYIEYDESSLIRIGIMTGDLGLAADAAQRAAKRAPLERDDEDPNALHRYKP